MKIKPNGDQLTAALNAEANALTAPRRRSLEERIASFDTSGAITVEHARQSGQEVIEVDVRDLFSNPYNPRVFYDEKIIAERGASLKMDGQAVPILVGSVEQLPLSARTSLMKPHQWVVIDGEYRQRGAKLEGIGKLLAIVDRSVSTPLSWYKRAQVCNKERDNGSIFDDALSLKLLLDSMKKESPELSDAAFANANGMDKSTLSRILKIARMPKPAAEILHFGGVGRKIAYEVAVFWESTEDERKTLAMAEKIIAAGMSLREVEAFRQKLLGESPKRERLRPVALEFHQGEAKGLLKTFSDGRLLLEIQGLSEPQRQLLFDELQERFVVKKDES